MLFSMINLCLFIIAQGEKEYLSNYTDAKVSCHNRGGLITQKLLTFDGLINTTCELAVNNSVLKDGETVWVQGHAQSGPYIALHTCMKFSNQDINIFVANRRFYSNILYECSVFCDQISHSTGFLGIYKVTCFCLSDSFRFPHTPECLENDFMDIHKGIIVFRLMRKLLLNVQSKSANFNCLGATFQESGKISYFNTKCTSTLYSICTQRVDSDLSNKCLPRLRDLCINKENSTFLDHYRNCLLYNGTLMPFISGITESFSFSVMLGSFRAFKAIEEDGENNGSVTFSCLSITQFNGTIYLETENCLNENALICMDDLRNASKQVESETTDGTTTNIVPIYIIIIIIIIIIILMLVIAVAILLWLRLRKNTELETKKKGRQHQKAKTPVGKGRLPFISKEGVSLEKEEVELQKVECNQERVSLRSITI
ncbi:uncharacterized protein LOC128238348 [Mya arenaria]|uniref:uncharacterized protein LOC128238348 n=1 Tax=Mya arenaria TaxID=6604 RepID=UPI0022E38169|nr:uncharacterized protein LOC128238348 [Mya arenaria]XP_052810144.1 uncharacterized protein LOC128238348 [Mya arenaria]